MDLNWTKKDWNLMNTEIGYIKWSKMVNSRLKRVKIFGQTLTLLDTKMDKKGLNCDKMNLILNGLRWSKMVENEPNDQKLYKSDQRVKIGPKLIR